MRRLCRKSCQDSLLFSNDYVIPLLIRLQFHHNFIIKNALTHVRRHFTSSLSLPFHHSIVTTTCHFYLKVSVSAGQPREQEKTLLECLMPVSVASSFLVIVIINQENPSFSSLLFEMPLESFTGFFPSSQSVPVSLLSSRVLPASGSSSSFDPSSHDVYSSYTSSFVIELCYIRGIHG